MVSGFISWTGAPPPPPRSCSSTGSRATPAGRLRVGTLMAHTPERFDDFAAAVAWARAANPRYTETMLRHRVTHGTRPANGGLVWKYDRAIRDAVRSGQWRDPVDLWPL